MKEVTIRPTARGGTELIFPGGYSRPAIVLTVCALISIGAIWLLLWPMPPGGFLDMLGHFGFLPVIFLLLALKLWFGSVRVTIESGTVKINSSVFGIGRTREMPCIDVAEVKLAGIRPDRETGTLFCDLQVAGRNGRTLTAAVFIRNTKEADSAIDEMRRAIETRR